jgi:molybdate/tungstate transport system substrate-binding protein
VNPAQHAGLSFAGLENGEIDALFLYRSMALERQFPFVALPDEINLGDVTRAESYARASFTTNLQQTFRGGPIRCSATILANAVNANEATEFVAYLLSPDGRRLVDDYHFFPCDILFSGDPTSVPTRLQPFVAHSESG